MIAYIRGIVADLEESTVIIENNKIGYEIFMPGTSMDRLNVGEEAKIFTYLHVREDAMQLYGFLSKDDLGMFKMLLNVNGIGPKGAIGVLSGIRADDLRFAILSDDLKTLYKLPGIGKKTAQKLVLELKDKINAQEALENRLSGESAGPAMPQGAGLMDGHKEAVEALVALGYSSTEAMRAVKMVKDTDAADVEAILKAALKNL